MAELQLPEGWDQKRLEDIGEIVTGNTPSKSEPAFYGKDYPFYKPTDLDQGYFTKSASDGLSQIGIKNARFLPVKSVLVTCIGATIGKTGLIRNEGACNQQINAIIPNVVIWPEYLYYYCTSGQFQRQIQENASSTTLPILNKSKFSKLSIPLPPLPIQRQIVARIEELFSEVDAGVKELQTALRQLKTYQQAVLHHYLSNEAWERVKLGSISETVSGYAFSSSEFKEMGPFQVIRMGNIRPDEIRLTEKPVFIDNVSADIRRKFGLQTGDLVITLTGTRTKRDYGYVAQVKKEKNLLLNQRLAAIRILSPNLPDFYNYILKTKDFQDQFFAYETGNVGQGNVSIRAVKDVEVPCPDLSTQTGIFAEIEAKLSEADAMEAAIRDGLAKAEALRQSILKRAFEGRLVSGSLADVSEAEALAVPAVSVGATGQMSLF